jgi:phosphatidylinositol-3-phosphatase
MRRWRWLVAAVLVVVGVVPLPAANAGAPLPTPAHIVIVIEENKPDGAVIGSKSAPYINALANSGANMTQSFAEAHPSEPNYLALFSGSTFGLTSDACPVDAGAAPNLASELLAAGYTFAGFSEDLPAVGSPACSAGKYARKHAPWVNFTNVPAATSVPFSAFNNRQDYASLPTVSFVIPNLDNDMHDGTIAQADTWLYNNLSHYANWAVANNSLLILTFDEDDGGSKNQIPTVVYGAHVKTGSYSEAISHYNVLATIEDMYGLPRTGLAANAPAISDVWA